MSGFYKIVLGLIAVTLMASAPLAQNSNAPTALEVVKPLTAEEKAKFLKLQAIEAAKAAKEAKAAAVRAAKVEKTAKKAKAIADAKAVRAEKIKKRTAAIETAKAAKAKKSVQRAELAAAKKAATVTKAKTAKAAKTERAVRISGKPPQRERVVYIYNPETKEWVPKAGSVPPAPTGIAADTTKPVKNNVTKKAVKKPTKKTAPKAAPKTAKKNVKPKPSVASASVQSSEKDKAKKAKMTEAMKAASQNKAADESMGKSAFKIDPQYLPQNVKYRTFEKSGTIVIDTDQRFLYLVLGWGKARRYGVGVGKDALSWSGFAKIGKKAEWPKWTPTNEMIAREPEKYSKFKDGMVGGLNNPLGARALYLHKGRNDTYFRIHGTTAPESIGTASSNGCIRMVNDHVIDLYERVPIGTKVVVLKADVESGKILQ